jgi:hypothetical protein
MPHNWPGEHEERGKERKEREERERQIGHVTACALRCGPTIPPSLLLPIAADAVAAAAGQLLRSQRAPLSPPGRSSRWAASRVKHSSLRRYLRSPS